MEVKNVNGFKPVFKSGLTDAIIKDIQNINIKSNRFDFEPEITAKVMKQHAKLVEVPITYAGRGHDEGKKINYKDGIQAILTLIKYRFIN